jgi:hypothetical protein
MGGCCCPSSTGPFSPILFFATSTGGNLAIPISTPVDVLTLGVSPPSPGQHQVKLDSTVQLLLNKPGGATTLTYNIAYRLQKDGATIATLIETGSFTVPAAPATYTLIPNLTWNDTITTSVTYTVEIQVITITAGTTVTAQTRALNSIVF